MIKPFLYATGLTMALLPMLASAGLDVRRDAREPAFAQVMYYYYQDQPYNALTTLLANRSLEFNSSGTTSVLLGDLYTRYGLTREADAALARSVGSDVTANNRNNPWLRYAKLLYNTQQDSLALNFLRKPPALLSPLQESERIIMIANILMRQESLEESIELLQNYRTPSPFYRQLARYNLALVLLQDSPENGKPISDDEKKRRADIALGILQDLMQGKVKELAPIIASKAQSTDKDDKGVLSGLFSKQSKAAKAAEKAKEKDLNSLVVYTYNQPLDPSAKLAPSAIRDLEVDGITESDRLNLKDKIALSLAYLQLTRDQPELARLALRDVRLNSPYSNQALLTSAHVYFQLGDFNRAYNFATELSNRDTADPMVQEGWLLAARALEELGSPNARERYQQALQVYKAQTAAIGLLSRQVEQIDILRLFPIATEDPILLDLPKVPQTPQAGLWAQLMDQADILSVLQQVQQTFLLQQRASQYGKRLDRLQQSNKMSADDLERFQDTQKLYEKVRNDFQKAGLQDRKALIARVEQPLQQRQVQLERYLTDALLGLQRLSQTAQKDR